MIRASPLRGDPVRGAVDEACIHPKEKRPVVRRLCWMREGRKRGRSGRFLLEVLHGLEHVVDVAGDLDAAPFFAQHAIRPDQEG